MGLRVRGGGGVVMSEGVQMVGEFEVSGTEEGTVTFYDGIRVENVHHVLGVTALGAICSCIGMLPAFGNTGIKNNY